MKTHYMHPGCQNCVHALCTKLRTCKILGTLRVRSWTFQRRLQGTLKTYVHINYQKGISKK